MVILVIIKLILNIIQLKNNTPMSNLILYDILRQKANYIR